MSEMDRLLKVVGEVEHLVCEDEELIREALEALQSIEPYSGEEHRYMGLLRGHWSNILSAITKLEARLLNE